MGQRGGQKRQRPKQQKRKAPENHDIDESSPVIQLFRQCQNELDDRHDRHERIVKHSRDITIESKRTIFLLHRMSGSSTPESTLEEAEKKLADIERTLWFEIAKELDKEDQYQFLRAYTHGLQEYIEALSFWYYLKEDTLISLQQVHQRLEFHTPAQDKNATPVEAATHSVVPEQTKPDDTAREDLSVDPDCSVPDCTETCTLQVHVPPQEYMLGIADLTGELMRMAINSVANGDLEKPAQLCKFMRVIYDAFVSFGNVGREMNQKSRVLKQSLVKVENACYNLQVRGSEIPKHMLKDVFSGAGGSGHETGEMEEFASAGD